MKRMKDGKLVEMVIAEILVYRKQAKPKQDFRWFVEIRDAEGELIHKESYPITHRDRTILEAEKWSRIAKLDISLRLWS